MIVTSRLFGPAICCGLLLPKLLNESSQIMVRAPTPGSSSLCSISVEMTGMHTSQGRRPSLQT